MDPALFAVLTSLAIGTPAAAQEQRWYDRASCKAAADAAMSAEHEEAERRARELDRGDLEDRVCAVWTRVNLAEIQLSLGGRLPALLDNRERRLFELFKLAKRYRQHPHIADLALEARVRRVRALVDRDEPRKALEEIRALEKMLEGRTDASGPTLAYVRGVVDMAVSQSGWALRAVVRLAGISGDAERGRRLLTELAGSDTVYASGAQYIRHHFAVESLDPADGVPADLMRPLLARHPTNPQFFYEYATDLLKAKDCKRTLEALTPLHARLDSDPTLWSNMMRAKLYWIGGRCAANLGQKERAKQWATLAQNQQFEPLKDKIDALLDDL